MIKWRITTGEEVYSPIPSYMHDKVKLEEIMEQQAADIMQNTQTFLLQISDLLIRYSVSTVGAFIIFFVGWMVASILQRWTAASLSHIRGLDQTIVKFFSGAIRYGILLIVLVMVLGQFGVQTASILAALGAIGLAIGLALQGTLQNIAAGIMLLVLRPFRVGEYISAGDIVGTVQEIGLFTTELKTYDGLYVMAPNSSLWNTPITNYSREKARMHDFKIGVAYEADVEKAFSVMRAVIGAEKAVVKSPEPIYFVDNLGDSAVVLCCRYWIRNDNYWNVVRETTKAVKAAFDEAKIDIPYPQVTYNIKSVGDAPEEAGGGVPQA